MWAAIGVKRLGTLIQHFSFEGSGRRVLVVSTDVASAACRINALPSHVLSRAISFLDARQLVQTCLLSRRWRHLWRSVPRINASRHEFDGMADSEEERNVLFKKFTNAFLVLRNPVALDEFRLFYFMPDHEESEDPDADSDDANLWINHALRSNARSVEPSISIPSLSYLAFSASGRIPSLKNMGSLVTASVSVSSGDTQVDDICQFLRSLSGVTNLDFDYAGMLKMEKSWQWCSKFNNLTALTLGEWCLAEDYYALKVFLRNRPNLVKLTLKLKQCNYTSETIIAGLKEGSFACQHIEVLEIVYSKGDPKVLEKLLVEGGSTASMASFRDALGNDSCPMLVWE
ncbi:hypothetical protein C2845_PM02G18250 [Panicum miliaceum]|uniref:F-box domain-containing protein n=1 Tax=Panicum miliaceum TaxID=4540 RepID=A0A3L6SDX3_PANMI|nr:hypothetical protein C2845_PM02G18250 [Panicum miliaceum]